MPLRFCNFSLNCYYKLGIIFPFILQEECKDPIIHNHNKSCYKLKILHLLSMRYLFWVSSPLLAKTFFLANNTKYILLKIFNTTFDTKSVFFYWSIVHHGKMRKLQKRAFLRFVERLKRSILFFDKINIKRASYNFVHFFLHSSK